MHIHILVCTANGANGKYMYICARMIYTLKHVRYICTLKIAAGRQKFAIFCTRGIRTAPIEIFFTDNPVILKGNIVRLSHETISVLNVNDLI